MAHFAVLRGEKDRWVCTETRLNQAREMMEAAGHTCSTWCPETGIETIDRFITTALRLDDPVALVYMGHGDPAGWAYTRKRIFIGSGIYPYDRLAQHLSKLRTGLPTVIVNECCYSGLAARALLQTEFDAKNLALLVTGNADGISTTPEEFNGPYSSSHIFNVLQAWFLEKRPFNPFLHSVNTRDQSGQLSGWEHWKCVCPERYGPTSVDHHFFGR